jgi:hypothetical protein
MLRSQSLAGARQQRRKRVGRTAVTLSTACLSWSWLTTLKAMRATVPAVMATQMALRYGAASVADGPTRLGERHHQLIRENVVECVDDPVRIATLLPGDHVQARFLPEE